LSFHRRLLFELVFGKQHSGAGLPAAEVVEIRRHSHG
jgi:hypothetical protein